LEGEKHRHSASDDWRENPRPRLHLSFDFAQVFEPLELNRAIIGDPFVFGELQIRELKVKLCLGSTLESMQALC
jgi:hypothetical protein